MSKLPRIYPGTGYYRHLNLPFATDMAEQVKAWARNDGGDFSVLRIFKPPSSVIDPRVVELLDDSGICVLHTEIFYTPPFAVLPIHVDGPVLSNRAKLNFVYDSPTSTMNWYRVKAGCEIPMLTTPIGTRYLKPNQEDCMMVAATRIRTPTLVNVGVPHSVINQVPTGRWCLSIVLGRHGTTDAIEWDEASSNLAKYAA